ncbi:MAG: hypothetical protein ACRCWF_11290 [Beijerinckiaceae bacterium]
MSIFQRLAIAGCAAIGIAGFAGSADAQYYYQPSPYGYRAQPAPQYVNPKILRKQRQLEQRVYQKYGYQQPQRYRQPNYGYQQPQYYPQQQYQQPRYRQAYPQQYYQQPQYQVAPRYVNPNSHMQLRQGQSYVE